jgi:hypothetical protein
MEGDFDLDGSFTLNDAATVAEAQFGKAYLPWQVPGGRARHLAVNSKVVHKD